MKMNIQPTYVTFEQSKLLKEKGFDVEGQCIYDEHGIIGNTLLSIKKYSKNIKEDTWNFSAPEQWQVVEWLRVEKNIFVNITYSAKRGRFIWEIMNLKDKFWTTAKLADCHLQVFDTPQEAYSAAFDYVLKELL